jgi:hypothetical protein
LLIAFFANVQSDADAVAAAVVAVAGMNEPQGKARTTDSWRSFDAACELLVVAFFSSPRFVVATSLGF